MLYSEFRDGNTPAGYEQLRDLQDSLRYLPASVKKVSLRSDSAGYQPEILLYCGEGKDPRFGVIEFAVSARRDGGVPSGGFGRDGKRSEAADPEVEGEPQQTGQEWAEVCYVPDWAGHSRERADYRFLAIREPLRQLEPGNPGNTPLYPLLTENLGRKGTYKLFGVVTNRKDAGDKVIWWLRDRRGKSEEV